MAEGREWPIGKSFLSTGSNISGFRRAIKRVLVVIHTVACTYQFQRKRDDKDRVIAEIAHNAMLSFIKTWLKHTRYKDIWKGAFEIARCDPNLAPMLYRLK